MKANKVTVVEEDSVPSLSRTEKNRLAALKKTISKSMETFLEVGRAIASIHDEKLYRVYYNTFADYCSDRWQMGRAHAYRMIDAVEVVEGLVKALGEEHPMPTNEAQIRILKKLDPEDRPEAWKRITENNAYHEAEKQVPHYLQEKYGESPSAIFDDKDGEQQHLLKQLKRIEGKFKKLGYNELAELVGELRQEAQEEFQRQ